MAVWKKLASATLGSAGDTLNSGTFAVNKFLYYEKTSYEWRRTNCISCI